MRKAALWGGGLLLGLYVLAVLALSALQRDLTYHPPGGLPPAQHMQEVRFGTADGLTLTAWYRPPQRPDGLVVVHFHGNADRIDWISFRADPFIAAGMGVMLVQFRGYGSLPGRPSEQGLYSDARGALAWLSRQGVAARQLVFYGYSLGSGVAVQMAAEQPAAALILEAPYTSVPDVAAFYLPMVPARWLMLDRFDSLAKIARIAIPLLVIHGERDIVIPIAHGRRLFAAAAGPKKALFLPQADHVGLFANGGAQAMVQFLSALPRP